MTYPTAFILTDRKKSVSRSTVNHILPPKTNKHKTVKQYKESLLGKHINWISTVRRNKMMLSWMILMMKRMKTAR